MLTPGEVAELHHSICLICAITRPVRSGHVPRTLANFAKQGQLAADNEDCLRQSGRMFSLVPKPL